MTNVTHTVHCHTPVCPADGIKSTLKLALLVLQWIVCSVHHYKLRTEEHVNIHSPPMRTVTVPLGNI